MSGPDRATGDGEEARIVERLVRLAGPRATPDPAARVRARAAARDAWRATVAARERRRRFVWLVPAAAAAVLLVLLLPRPERQPLPQAEVARVVHGDVDVRRDGGPHTRAASGDVLRAGESIATGPGATSALRLAGGGELRLNAGTSLRLVSRRRFALDTGHVYVDTGAPSDSPLAIETAAGLVRDIGTRFDVQVVRDRLRVRVREGAVALEHEGRQTKAGAGQQLVASPAGTIDLAPTDTYGPDWNWITLAAAPFDIERATLESFLGWIERESGRSVVFDQAGLRQSSGPARLHGSIAGLTPEEALQAVLPAVGLSYRIQGERFLIEREERRR
jgi:hypothetical protein